MSWKILDVAKIDPAFDCIQARRDSLGDRSRRLIETDPLVFAWLMMKTICSSNRRGLMVCSTAPKPETP